MGSANIIIIVAVIAACIVALLIVIVVVILICRRRKPNEKCKYRNYVQLRILSDMYSSSFFTKKERWPFLFLFWV